MSMSAVVASCNNDKTIKRSPCRTEADPVKPFPSASGAPVACSTPLPFLSAHTGTWLVRLATPAPAAPLSGLPLLPGDGTWGPFYIYRWKEGSASWWWGVWMPGKAPPPGAVWLLGEEDGGAPIGLRALGAIRWWCSPPRLIPAPHSPSRGTGSGEPVGRVLRSHHPEGCSPCAQGRPCREREPTWLAVQ